MVRRVDLTGVVENIDGRFFALEKAYRSELTRRLSQHYQSAITFEFEPWRSPWRRASRPAPWPGGVEGNRPGARP